MATRKVKVAPERRGLKKVWNISDWGATSVEPQSVMVLGVSVAPGTCIEVPGDRLENAHKLMKSKAEGLLFIGDHPPAAYTAFKQRKPRVRLAPSVQRSHGPPKGTVAPPKKVKAKPVAKPKAEEPAPKKEASEKPRMKLRKGKDKD
jgi:hypothetical protein